MKKFLFNEGPVKIEVGDIVSQLCDLEEFHTGDYRWSELRSARPDDALNLIEVARYLIIAAENDDWDAYHTFRKQQRHVRLYNLPFPNQVAIEVQALNCVPLVDAQPVDPACQATPVQNPGNLDTRQDYYNLPLAA